MCSKINQSYIPPMVNNTRFTCPYCNAVAQQLWENALFYKTRYSSKFINGLAINGDIEEIMVKVSTCQSCFKPHIWINNKMIIPEIGNIPLPSEDMPSKVKEIYNEAREVFPKSFKAAAALLRLAIQHLCIELGYPGKNINSDIASMVRNGLPSEVQKALDIIRVTGNDSVHPGEMNLEDNEDIAVRLFSIVNFIVDKLIVEPKEREEIFNWLPNSKKEAIKNRDKKNP